MQPRYDCPYVAKLAAALLLTLVALAACGSPEPVSSDLQKYKLHGKVVQLEPENQAATIEHDEIAGWMDAMTMRFLVNPKSEWEKLSVGAAINATVFVSDDGFYVGDVEVLEPEPAPAPEQP